MLVSFVENICARMSALGTYELTHPELLSESQLRDVLRNSCIDFSNYEKLSKDELLEIYKRVAMPLPQRQIGSNGNSDSETNLQEKYPSNGAQRNSNYLNTNVPSLKRNFNATTKTESFSGRRSLSPASEPTKKLRLSNSENGTECNGLDKRAHDEMQDENSSMKRQKITWP